VSAVFIEGGEGCRQPISQHRLRPFSLWRIDPASLGPLPLAAKFT